MISIAKASKPFLLFVHVIPTLHTLTCVFITQSNDEKAQQSEDFQRDHFFLLSEKIGFRKFCAYEVFVELLLLLFVSRVAKGLISIFRGDALCSLRLKRVHREPNVGLE